MTVVYKTKIIRNNKSKIIFILLKPMHKVHKTAHSVFLIAGHVWPTTRPCLKLSKYPVNVARTSNTSHIIQIESSNPYIEFNSGDYSDHSKTQTIISA